MDIQNQEPHHTIRSAIQEGKTAEALSLLADESHLRMMTPFGSWLHVAAKVGNLEIVKALVCLGLDVNLRGGIFGGSAINLAAAYGHLEVVRFLLHAGSQLDVSEPERNPLFSAVQGGHIDIVRFLVEAGIDHRVCYTGDSMQNMDALAFAQERVQTKIAEFLTGLRKK